MAFGAFFSPILIPDPLIERKIRVIKERARGTISVLPYKILPKLMIIDLKHFCVMWLNSFPV